MCYDCQRGICGCRSSSFSTLAFSYWSHILDRYVHYVDNLGTVIVISVTLVGWIFHLIFVDSYEYIYMCLGLHQENFSCKSKKL